MSVKKMSKALGARLSIAASMTIFGTVGIFVRSIALSSAVIALVRGIIGTLFLIAVSRIRGKAVSLAPIKGDLPMLCASGALIGINWILLFESYRHTSVAVATVCYYMAPMFVILASPLVFRERLTLKKSVCAAVAFLGSLLVSGVIGAAPSSAGGFLGAALALGAAALYASVVIINKKVACALPYEGTVVQLSAASVALLPYVLLTAGDDAATLSLRAALLLVTVGVVHTGFAYALYFSAIKDVPAQSTAIMSYIDPAVAIIASAVILGERLAPAAAIGAVLVLGSALLSELERPLRA